jgi:multidrug resistance efflux pump
MDIKGDKSMQPNLKIKLQTLFENSFLGKRLKKFKTSDPEAGHKLSSLFGANSRLVAPALILLVLLLIAGGYYLLEKLVNTNKDFSVSGTVEVTEIHLGSETGGRVDRVKVKEGEKVQTGQVVAEVHGDKVYATVNGIVIDRAAEPGEIVAAGTTLVTIGDLDDLTLTVYVPEDRYGQIILGQVCQVTADSFPGRTFKGTVTHIADQAEFTPRNVQTTDSRKTTVFAIRLSLDPSGGLLKPGMPGDVRFQNFH